MSGAAHAAGRTDEAVDAALARVREALSSLRYGNVQITIHDGRIVQVDVTEKQRFTSSSGPA